MVSDMNYCWMAKEAECCGRLFNTIHQLKGKKTHRIRIVLVWCEVIGFTRSGEAFLIDSTDHHDLAVVHDGPEHGPGRLHGRQLPPLRLLVVVCEHLVEGFAVEKHATVTQSSLFLPYMKNMLNARRRSFTYGFLLYLFPKINRFFCCFHSHLSLFFFLRVRFSSSAQWILSLFRSFN